MVRFCGFIFSSVTERKLKMAEDAVAHQKELIRAIEVVVDPDGRSRFCDEFDNHIELWKELVLIAHSFNRVHGHSFARWKDSIESCNSEDPRRDDGHIIGWLADKEEKGCEEYIEIFEELYTDFAIVPTEEPDKLGRIVPRETLEDEFPELGGWMEENLPDWNEA